MENKASSPALPSSRKLRIGLISPRGPLYRHGTGIWKKAMRYAPLTLTTLASLIPDAINAEVTLVDEGMADIDPNIEANLIGISAITGTAPRSYELAAHFRRRGVPVVLGGVHPTLMAEEAATHVAFPGESIVLLKTTQGDCRWTIWANASEIQTGRKVADRPICQARS